jgi:hypothetical protein
MNVAHRFLHGCSCVVIQASGRVHNSTFGMGRLSMRTALIKNCRGSPLRSMRP